MTFSEIANAYFPRFALRVRVGETETYIGKRCRGISEMCSSQRDWLDSHKPIHVYRQGDEIVIVFRGSKKYHEIVWGF